MGSPLQIKRAYDPVEPDDGYRVLIDHVWPRGISRERAQLDEWARDLAPSDELRRWFDHVPERFPEFRTRYLKELEARRGELEALGEHTEHGGRVTIVYAARDREHNNAVVVAELLRSIVQEAES